MPRTSENHPPGRGHSIPFTASKHTPERSQSEAPSSTFGARSPGFLFYHSFKDSSSSNRGRCHCGFRVAFSSQLHSTKKLATRQHPPRCCEYPAGNRSPHRHQPVDIGRRFPRLSPPVNNPLPPPPFRLRTLHTPFTSAPASRLCPDPDSNRNSTPHRSPAGEQE